MTAVGNKKGVDIMKKWISLVLACVLLMSCLPMPATVEAAQFTDTGVFQYYYDQLTTSNSQTIYNLLVTMLNDGRLQTGTASVELLTNGVSFQSREALMVDFIAARDAFMLDHNVFYVDFDKLSVTYTESGASQQALMGIGREDTYLRDGYYAGNVAKAVGDFEAVVDQIAETAARETELEEQVRSAYTQVMDRVEYALEQDAKPENVPFVRDAFGALVKGQSVCEGYARAMKAVLDKMGIANVLVQGMYADEKGELVEPHMWNYVRMDDYRWYLLDATMGDGHAPYAQEDLYFLCSTKDQVFEDYLSDGQISLSSNSKVFVYPELSTAAYVPLSDAFYLVDDNASMVSYCGMNFRETEEAGKTILCSYNGSQWYYYANYMCYFFAAVSDYESTVYKYDSEGCFNNVAGLGFFAVTDLKAPDQPVRSQENLAAVTDLASYVFFNGKPEEIYDMSQVGEATNLTSVRPFVVEREPVTSLLRGGQTYEVKLRYSKDLKLGNAAVAPTLTWLNESDFLKESGAAVSDFQWDGKATISFTLTTATTYDARLTYSFRLNGLVGSGTTSAPQDFSFSVYNISKFACPKIEGDINVVYANTPALIADNNLAENEWVGENGAEISKDLPNRLALVATTLTGDAQDKLLSDIPGANASNSQTFDLSLGLCGTQVAYVTGKPVKVFIPFPEGYTPGQTNVTFKAYHFDADGNAEEVNCVTTEKGIIVMCSAFSPYAVTAVEGASADKKVVITATGNGSTSDADDFVSLAAGASETVTITADPGYVIDRVLLNGQELADRSGKKTTQVTLSADALEANNTLEATFVLQVMSSSTSETDYVASLSTTMNEPVVGEPFTVSVDVTRQGQSEFASAELKVSFDPNKLTFNQDASNLNGAEVTVTGGVIDLADYGASQSLGNGVYQLSFTPTEAGAAEVLLSEAAFSDQESASDYDLVESALSSPKLTLQIQRQQFSVTLADIFTGPETVYNGDDYTFRVENPHYNYGNIQATVDGHKAEVIANGDGTYTVKNVTGKLVITGERTPKSFEVDFQPAGLVQVESYVATYLEDYAFPLPTDIPPSTVAGTHYSVDTITIGGQPYTGFSELDRVVTIPGVDVIGDIVVTIKATPIDRNQATVDVQGTGAGFVTDYANVADLNKPYSLTVIPAAGWGYTITATMGGQTVTLVSSGDTYTVENVTGDLVFTVERVLIKDGLMVHQYLSVDGATMWLVVNTTQPEGGHLYTYDGSPMFWSDDYKGYCYLVLADNLTVDDASAKIDTAQGEAVKIVQDGDVNMTNIVDANDAQLVYNIYNAMYNDFDALTMEKFLRADVTHNGMVNVGDASAIIQQILGITTAPTE